MFKITFEFEDRELKCMDYVNAALLKMQLKGVRVKDSDGYIAVRTIFDSEDPLPVETTYMHGIDKLILACETGEEEDEDLHLWQIDSWALPKYQLSGSNEFHAMWCEEHPDRVMRSLTRYSYGEMDAYFVLHHERSD